MRRREANNPNLTHLSLQSFFGCHLDPTRKGQSDAATTPLQRPQHVEKNIKISAQVPTGRPQRAPWETMHCTFIN